MRTLKNASIILGKTILLVILFLVTFIMLSVLAGRVISVGSVDQSFIQKATFIVQTVSVILSILMIYMIFDQKRDLYLGWGQPNKFKDLLEGCLWGIGCITATFFIIWVLRGIKISSFSFEKSTLASMLFPLVLYMFVSVNEELLTRGYLYGLIKRDFGTISSIIITSILFSLLHIGNPNILQNPLPLTNLFLAGILFGVAREASGGLWVPIGLHFTWNFFLGNIYGLAVSGMDIGQSIIKTELVGHPLINGGGFGPEGSIIASLVIVVFSVVIWKRYRNRKLHKSI